MSRQQLSLFCSAPRDRAVIQVISVKTFKTAAILFIDSLPSFAWTYTVCHKHHTHIFLKRKTNMLYHFLDYENYLPSCYGSYIEGHMEVHIPMTDLPPKKNHG